MASKPRIDWTSGWVAGIAVGLLGWFAVISTLDPSGSYPNLIQGPGITLDESFNVQQGVLLVEAFRAYGPFMFDPMNAKELYGGEGDIPYLPDHPPLGRWVLGIAHHLFANRVPPTDPVGPAITAAARAGSAVLFGLTIFLIATTSGRWFGWPSGWTAAFAVLMMPRLFGHAHIASLETCVNLTYGLAVIMLASTWSRFANHFEPDETRPRLTWKRAIFSGIWLGLALLTKIQGFLLIPPVIVWALWYWRKSAVLPLIVWGGVGGLLFFLGWPWLWLDPIGHTLEFLGSATDRATLHNYYFGAVYDDVATPWHYPWVMFLLTVPAGFQILGFLGAIQTVRNWRTKPASILALLCILFPLVLFSTNVAVYDGTRLFLMVFPLWGLFIGLGGKLVWNWLQRKKLKQARWAAVVFFLLVQSWGLWGVHPNQLSFYNMFAGGVRGAHALGLETTYWGDSLTREFLLSCEKQIPEGATVEITPVLHQFQCEEIAKQSPIVRRNNWKLIPYQSRQPATDTAQDRYVIVVYRRADLPPEFMDEVPVLIDGDQPERLAKFGHMGVVLTELYRFAAQAN